MFYDCTLLMFLKITTNEKKYAIVTQALYDTDGRAWGEERERRIGEGEEKTNDMI